MQQLSLNGLSQRDQDLNVVCQKFAKALLELEPNFEVGSEPDVWAECDPFDLACESYEIRMAKPLKYSWGSQPGFRMM